MSLSTDSSLRHSLVRPARGRVVCALGPTNTGKTHLAIERMLGHASGMIGLPLRLLAREIYDRIVPRAGRGNVALITGEEKILPRNPSYYVCTVESMPLNVETAFLAVDEIQLCADPDRGHVFTDRLLRGRGTQETMFMGAATIEPLLRKLLPFAEFERRARFSQLVYTGAKTFKQLPRRSAVVAFSSAEVYRLAELLRRQRGGAAVVLGALSPRTRNAQVQLYQDGQVDYLVATDAIGMGLNMDIDHVAFASLRKFDGVEFRDLSVQEMAQIAGRAGRHMNDGTFGTVGGEEDAPRLSPETVEAIESHRFEPVHRLFWRNARLEFDTLRALIDSLEAPAPSKLFVRKSDAEDLQVLKSLAGDSAIRDRAGGPAAVARLWQACQIPDFRKVLPDIHARLVKQIYRHLMSDDGVIAEDWLTAQIEPLGRVEGDIDTLSARIAHIRTWTYVANQPDWLERPAHWRERTREIEDKLSDALHARLTQRFVDARTTVLMRELRKKDEIYASVTGRGEVQVEGHYIGRLQGLEFIHDGGEADDRLLRHAAQRALRHEMARRIKALGAETDFTLSNGRIYLEGAALARLRAGHHILAPRIELLPNALIGETAARQLRHRLQLWLEARIGGVLSPLSELQNALTTAGEHALSAPARGLVFQLIESLGHVPRRRIASLARDIDREERRRLRKRGVRFGQTAVFIPALIKPEAARWCAELWSAFHGEWPAAPPPKPGQIHVPAERTAPGEWYAAWGYRRIAARALRLDIIEKIAWALRKALQGGHAPDMKKLQAWAGASGKELDTVCGALGYRLVKQEDGAVRVKRKRRGPPRKSRKGGGRSRPRPAKPSDHERKR